MTRPAGQASNRTCFCVVVVVVGQPENEVLDRHGAQHAPADVDGRLRGRRNEGRASCSVILSCQRYMYGIYMYVMF